MLKMIENNTKAWIKSVSRINASLRYFYINLAKSVTKEPRAGNFGESVKI
jgi:hypothetical protein